MTGVDLFQPSHPSLLLVYHLNSCANTCKLSKLTQPRGFPSCCTRHTRNLHLFSDLHLFNVKHPYIIPPFASHSTPNTQQTLNTHPHPAPIWPGAGGGGGSGARVQTEVIRKWLFSLAPRSWPQHPSTFHFSLSLHTLNPRMCWSVWAPHFYSFTSPPLSSSLHVTGLEKQCNNFCLNPNCFHISKISEGWMVNSCCSQNCLWKNINSFLFFMTR